MNKEANAKRLLAIQARFAKATKGPWTRGKLSVNVVTLRKTRYGKRTAIVGCGDIHPEDQHDPDTTANLQADADFIAHSRGDIAYLLNRINQLEFGVRVAARQLSGSRSTAFELDRGKRALILSAHDRLAELA